MSRKHWTGLSTSRQRVAGGRGRWALVVAAALIIAGCVNPAFRGTTAKFGTLTKATVDAQNAEINAVIAARQEGIRAGLAASRADLRVRGSCTAALRQRAGESAAPCVIERRLPGNRFEAVPQPPSYDNILALGTALSNYAGSLATLAGDFSESETKFGEAVAGVATSIGGLDRTIRSLSGQAERNVSEQLGAVAILVSRLGNLYFAHERNRVLKEIIIEGDVLVQRAADLLADTDSVLQTGLRNDLLRELRAAERDAVLKAASQRATIAEVRAAQNRLFTALAAYNAQGTDIRRFRAIATAHAALKEAAEAGTTAAELRSAIEAIIDLASLTHQTVTALRQDEGSSDDDN